VGPCDDPRGRAGAPRFDVRLRHARGRHCRRARVHPRLDRVRRRRPAAPSEHRRQAHHLAARRRRVPPPLQLGLVVGRRRPELARAFRDLPRGGGRPNQRGRRPDHDAR
jgi:hypothetical protein